MHISLICQYLSHLKQQLFLLYSVTLLKLVAYFNPEYPALRFSNTRNWQFRRVKLHSTNELNVLHKASFSQ